MSRERSTISKKNQYYIEKERYLELKYFCKQYKSWIRNRAELYYSMNTASIIKQKDINNISDTTTFKVVNLENLTEYIKIIEDTVYETDPIIGTYILKGIIDDVGYDCINAYNKIPCGRNKYYELYRRFFWILSSKR